MVVIYMVVEPNVGSEVTKGVGKVGKVVNRECRKAKSAQLEFAFVSAFRDNSSFELNILGPLCLWQCFVPLHSSRRAKLAPLLLESIKMRTNLPERWVEAKCSGSHFYCNIFQQQNYR